MTTSRNPNDWFDAVVETVVEESPSVKTFGFRAPFPITHLPGQYYELRLTAENGYQAARPYSAATPADGHLVTLTIMTVPDGEVSPYVNQELAVGDTVELRGPFGKFFVWTTEETRPVLLIGGGSGIVPLHAIFKARTHEVTMKVLYSNHTFDDILYKQDFLDNDDVTITLTREQPADWTGPTGRISIDLLKDIVGQFPEMPVCYVCGMSGFVEHIADGLMAAKVPIELIKTERFG